MDQDTNEIEVLTTMETPVNFNNDGQAIRGVLHTPDGLGKGNGIGVIFLHGWSGSRLGPHRMFVKAARRLCSAGCHCLRFDFLGRGDSDGATSEASIQSMISDAVLSAHFLRQQDGISELVILGICSGAKVAIGAAARCKEIDKLVLWSAEPMGNLKSKERATRKSGANLRKYWRKLSRPETWRKLLKGRVHMGLVGKALWCHETSSHNEVEQETRIMDQFRKFSGPILYIYGTNDPETAAAAKGYEQFCRESGITGTFHTIEGANHSFYSLQWEQEVVDLTVNWLESRD